MFSRDYLRNLPNLERQRIINLLVNELFTAMEQDISSSALMGRTQCIYNMSRWRQERAGISRLGGSPPEHLKLKPIMVNGVEQRPHVLDEINGELIEGLKAKFPECIVAYQEDWVQPETGPKYLRKSVLVDWS
jgi:hypothetical protein